MQTLINFLQARKQEISGVAVFILVILAVGYVETNYMASLLCIAGIAIATKIGGLDNVNIN